MIRADDVVHASFAQTQFADGYDEQQVDEFLDRVVGALRHHEAGAAGPAGLTAADVHAVRFASVRARRGYSLTDVDELLAQVVQTLAEYEGVTPPAPDATPHPTAGSDRPTASPSGGTNRPSLGARVLRALRGDPR